MALIEINEPGQHESIEEEIVVGIDFGTTNSLIAISTGGKAQVIPSEDGDDLIKSIYSQSGIAITSVKRLLGKTKQEIKNSPILFSITQNKLDENSESVRLNINGELLSPIQIASNIFLTLKNNATKYLGRKVTKVVVTVPAYFDDAAKGEILLAAKLARLQVIRLLAEPTAAAYAYGINKKVKGVYAVYDLGGGTFDISVLSISKGIIQVQALGGDNMLGGDDIDHLLKNFLQDKYNLIDSEELLHIAREIKEQLTYNQNVTINQLTIDNLEFDKLIKPLIERTIDIAKNVFLKIDDVLDGIILVGGSTKIPLIKKLISENFNTKILCDIDPDRTVAIGAALQAENLTTHNNMLLIDAVALSLGLEQYGGGVEKLILRNSPLPITITKQYTTQVDNQSAITIHIVQGEREFAKDCRSLAYFELADLPPAKAGSIKIEVTFALDTDGILSVSALNLNTGISHIIEINPTYGLGKQEIDNILLDSYKNATIDHQNMLLKEKIIESQSLIRNLEKIIKIMKDTIELTQNTKINDAIALLQKSMKTEDLNLIMKHYNELSKMSGELMKNKLDNLVTARLKGKNIDEL